MTPDFLAIGHVVRDLQPQGWRLGGTVTFAAVQAQRLALASAIVTCSGPDVDLASLLPNIESIALPSDVSTTFQNVYNNSERQQLVLQQAVSLAPEDVPLSWRAAQIVLIGPVCGEIRGDPGTMFTRSLVGVSAQGWLRQVGPDNQIRRVPWSGEPFWAGCDALFVSEEDLGEHPEAVERWRNDLSIVAITRAGRGARIHAAGSWMSIGGFPADERDPTGAGDVFAAAFMVRYHESRAVEAAARFASAAASCAVEGTGIETIASRHQIEQRMARYPEIVLA